MSIFTRLFKGGSDDGSGSGDATDGEAEALKKPVLATAGAPAFAVEGPKQAMMTAKPEGPAKPPRAPLPSVPRAKTPPAQAAVVSDDKAKQAKSDRNDATMVMSPPPAAPAPTASTRTAARMPPPKPPAPAPAPTRTKPDSIEMRLDEVVMEISSEPPIELGPAKPARHGVSSASDLAEVRKLFQEVAVAHVAQVRDVMLELRYGGADPRWIGMTKPALQSLRAMAKEMDLVELTTSLDEFCGAVERAVAARAIDDAGKAVLLERYQRLIELIPQAFELDAERDRREPIIVEALLCQIEGVERPTIDRLFSVGLNRLEALMNANAGDVAAVSNLRPELAAKIVEHFKAYRASASATVAAPDPLDERRKLADLLVVLSLQNDDFNKVSAAWTDEANQRKRTLRKQRDQTFQQIKVALARLGEREQLSRLEKMAFNDRIATIDRWLSAQQAHAPRP